MAKTAVFGFHGDGNKEVFVEVSRILGYDSELMGDLEELKRRVKENDFRSVIMDINYGRKNGVYTEPSEVVYRILEDRIKSGEVKFLGISANSDTVEAAKKKGIPAMVGEDFIPIAAEFFD